MNNDAFFCTDSDFSPELCLKLRLTICQFICSFAPPNIVGCKAAVIKKKQIFLGALQMYSHMHTIVVLLKSPQKHHQRPT